MKKEICQSVGAIVKNSRGHYLVLYRMKFPEGLALPAGHPEFGENPYYALVRELEEETGLRVKRACLRFTGVIRNRCRLRAKKHRWHVYVVSQYSGRPKRREKKKHAFVKFMSPKQIREVYLEKQDVDPAWVEIFKKLKIMQ